MDNKSKIEKYLLEERKLFGAVFVEVFSKITKYEDIEEEFCKWLDRRNYDFENQVVIRGYSAKDINGMALFLESVGVYNFLVTLRDNPEEAKRIISKNFKI